MIRSEKAEAAFSVAAQKLQDTVTKHPDLLPAFTYKGKWQPQKPGWTSWCDGFLGGELWLLFLYNRNDWFRDQAENYSKLVKPSRYDKSVHDLGFIFMPTWKRWYDVSGDPKVLEVLIEAGRTLAKRHQKNGKYIFSFQGRHSLYIDIMMNVPLIFETALQTKDEPNPRYAVESSAAAVAANGLLFSRSALPRFG